MQTLDKAQLISNAVSLAGTGAGLVLFFAGWDLAIVWATLACGYSAAWLVLSFAVSGSIRDVDRREEVVRCDR